MNSRHAALLLFPLALAACGKSSDSSSSGNSADSAPSAVVETVTLAESKIATTVTAYGTVIAQPGELQSVAVQYESRVTHLLVSAGEPVEKGTPLIEIQPSPDAELALSVAKSDAETSQAQLQETQHRFDMKLAVNQELDQAKQAARDAKEKLSSLEKRAAVGPVLKADVQGVVGSISVSIGQLIPTGNPLLAIVPQERIEVLLGIEPENIGSLSAGQAVTLVPINQNGVKIVGKIRLVTRRINPQTRLIDAFVTVPPGTDLLLDGYVLGQIQTKQKTALVVPRNAVLPTVDGSVLFTVENGQAIRHQVTTGMETDTLTEVSGDSLKIGSEVVTTGNYQLEDGMKVNSAPDKSDP